MAIQQRDAKLHLKVKLIEPFVKKKSLEISGGGSPRGVMVKAIDCGIVVSGFELQSRYYVHFRTNTLGKDMKLIILPMG